jgi:hypothetical protein
MRKLAPFLDENLPIAFEFPTLVRILLRDSQNPADDAFAVEWLTVMRDLISAFREGEFPAGEFLAIAKREDDLFNEMAAKSCEIFERSGSTFARSAEKHGAKFALDGMTEVIRMRELRDSNVPWMSEAYVGERIDAACRYHAFLLLAAGMKNRYATDKYENDFEDIKTLYHLARPSIIATRDFALIEGVDACGTYQSPWVVTLGEILSGRVPDGEPWGGEARRLRKSFVPRNRKVLGDLETEVFAGFATAADETPGAGS